MWQPHEPYGTSSFCTSRQKPFRQDHSDKPVCVFCSSILFVKITCHVSCTESSSLRPLPYRQISFCGPSEHSHISCLCLVWTCISHTPRFASSLAYTLDRSGAYYYEQRWWRSCPRSLHPRQRHPARPRQEQEQLWLFRTFKNRPCLLCPNDFGRTTQSQRARRLEPRPARRGARPRAKAEAVLRAARSLPRAFPRWFTR